MANCAVCAAALSDSESQFARCSACGTAMYVGEDEAIAYYRLRATLQLGEAGQAMRRWMTENVASTGVNGVVTLGEPRAYDHLFWAFRASDAGFDMARLVPATRTPLQELAVITMPQGALASAVPAMEAVDGAMVPSIPWQRAAGAPSGERPALVRVPLYEFPYSWNGRGFRVIVDGVTGQCLVHRVPRTSNAGYAAVLALSLGAFALEGWVLWGSGMYLVAAYVLTAVPAGVVTFYMLRSSSSLPWDRR